MSTKNSEVSVTAFATVLVIAAESEEQAMEFALRAIDLGDMQHDETKIERVVKDVDLDAARRHADAISEDE